MSLLTIIAVYAASQLHSWSQHQCLGPTTAPGGFHYRLLFISWQGKCQILNRQSVNSCSLFSKNIQEHLNSNIFSVFVCQITIFYVSSPENHFHFHFQNLTKVSGDKATRCRQGRLWSAVTGWEIIPESHDFSKIKVLIKNCSKLNSNWN